MAKKLYVGSLPYSTTEADLRALFEACGAVVSATVIIDRMSGRSKGFGFVEMSSDEEADAAVQKLHGSEMGGRKLVVNEARPLGERKPGGGGMRGGFRKTRDNFDRGGYQDNQY